MTEEVYREHYEPLSFDEFVAVAGLYHEIVLEYESAVCAIYGEYKKESELKEVGDGESRSSWLPHLVAAS